MNQINFNQVGGFPMTTRILDELQKAFTVFNGLGAISGNMTILSGCETVGTNVANGVVYVNGEVLEFRGGTAQTKVKIVEAVENLVFEDNVSKPVIKTRYITFGTGVGAMDWEDFKRPIETKALELMLGTINTSLTAIVTKLNTIDLNAKVQLQSDFAQTDNTKKDYIKNMPGFINFLYKGVFAFGDSDWDDMKTVTFPTVGTNNYLVVGCMVSVGNNWNDDNDLFWMIRDKQNSSFKILTRELVGDHQNLSFEYMLIPL